MKILRVGLLVVLVLFLLAVGGAGYLLNSLVSGEQKERIVALATERLGTPVHFDSYRLDYPSLLALQPALVVKGLRIANPPGFPDGNLLEAEQMALRVDLRSALNRRIEVEALSIESPRIRIESLPEGTTNVEVVLNNLKKAAVSQDTSAQAPPAEGAAKELAMGVTTVEVRNAVVLLSAPGEREPRETLRGLDLTLSDIRAGSPSRLDMTSKLFDSTNTNVHIAGTAGPLSGDGLAIDGTLDMELALAEFPDTVRKRYLGELASAPGPASRIRLALTVKGDLYGTTNGAGKIEFSQFLIGGGKENRLLLSGEAPLAIRAEKAISGGDLTLQSRSARLQLGSGEWAGDLSVRRRRTRLSGETRGAIRNVDVNQMLTSFADAPGVASGTLTIPEFRMTFQGDSAAALHRSLDGGGKLRVDKGEMKAVRVLASIERALGGAPSDTGSFAKFQSDFSVKNEVIAFRETDVTGPAIRLNGEGTVGFNEVLNFRLESRLEGTAAALLKTRTGNLAGDVSIPVTITGTVANPQVKPDVGGLTKRAVKSAVGSIMESLLNRRERKPAEGAPPR